MWPETDRIVVATRNAGKVREFAHLFAQAGIQVAGLADFNDLPDVIEDGNTFRENAEKKARAIAHALRMPVLADDSGLCVDALDGRPGVYSARYAGEPASDEANNRKLLAELNALLARKAIQPQTSMAEGSPIRLLSPARFVCALAFFDPRKEDVLHVEERCEGWIADKPLGDNGFGYDPLFFVPEYGKTMAQLTMEEKAAVSHRGKAMRRLYDALAAGR